MFYISGTVKEDRTLKTDKNMKKFILMDSENLQDAFEYIREMNTNFGKVQEV